MKYYFEGRELVDLELEHHEDYTMVCRAVYLDTGEEADQAVLEYLQDNYDFSFERLESAIGRAESYWENDR